MSLDRSVPSRSRLKCLGVAAIVAAVLAAVSASGPASASCVAPTPGDAMSTAQVVFLGTVTAVDTQGATTYRVEEIWKGTNLPDPVTVYPVVDPATGRASGPPQQIGTRYLVFPTVDSDGNLRDPDCSPTSVYRAGFDALRPAGAHAPQGPPTSGVPGETPLAAIFLVILVIGSIGGFCLYRTGGRPGGTD